MLPRQSTAKLLIIKGISPTDFDIKVDKIEFTIDDTYDELPTMFSDVESWPKATNLLCWYCDGKVIGYPKFIPVYEHVDAEKCSTHGNFCDWSCASAYIHKEFPPHMIMDLQSRLCKYRAYFVSDNTVYVLPAEPKHIMKIYCGPRGISRDEFEKRRRELKNLEVKK